MVGAVIQLDLNIDDFGTDQRPFSQSFHKSFFAGGNETAGD